MGYNYGDSELFVKNSKTDQLGCPPSETQNFMRRESMAFQSVLGAMLKPNNHLPLGMAISNFS
jgi:hypothetical protein